MRPVVAPQSRSNSTALTVPSGDVTVLCGVLSHASEQPVRAIAAIRAKAAFIGDERRWRNVSFPPKAAATAFDLKPTLR